MPAGTRERGTGAVFRLPFNVSTEPDHTHSAAGGAIVAPKKP